MAIVSKTTRDGLDIVIEQLQQKFYPLLIAYWDTNATYQCYPRANKNYRDDNIIPELSIDEKDYECVLFSDKYSVTSFFVAENARTFQDENKRIKQRISIIFQADLTSLYGAAERFDEKFNSDVLRVLKKENFYIYGDIDFQEGIDSVYSDLSISGDLKEKIKVTDMSEMHVLKVSFDVIYKPNCNSTLPPVCSGVSVSVDGVFSEVVPAGGVYNCVTSGSNPLDITVNGDLVYDQITTDKNFTVVDQDDNQIGFLDGPDKWLIENSVVTVKNSADDVLDTVSVLAFNSAESVIPDVVMPIYESPDLVTPVATVTIVAGVIPNFTIDL